MNARAVVNREAEEFDWELIDPTQKAVHDFRRDFLLAFLSPNELVVLGGEDRNKYKRGYTWNIKSG